MSWLLIAAVVIQRCRLKRGTVNMMDDDVTQECLFVYALIYARIIALSRAQYILCIYIL